MEAMCRLCLRGGPGQLIGATTQDMIELIFRYLSIQIIKRECFPNQRICLTCRTSIESWHLFRESCIKNDDIFQNLLSNALPEGTSEETHPTNPVETVELKEERPKEECEKKECDDQGDEVIDHQYDDEQFSSSDDEYLVKLPIVVPKKRVKRKTAGDGSLPRDNMPLKKRGRPRKEKGDTESVRTVKELQKNSSNLITIDTLKEDQESDDENISDESISKKGKKRGRPLAANKVGKRAEVCTICGKFIKNMPEHMRIHNNEKRYQCPYCPKAFVSASNYNSHVNIHTRAKMYKCDLCDKQYAMLNSLKQHRITHFKERIYLCPVCGKAYYQPTGLARHKRTHYEEPKIKCSECDRMFLTNADLKKHFTKHLDEKPYNCEVCNRAFSRKDNLRTHMKTHRGITQPSKNVSLDSKAPAASPADLPNAIKEDPQELPPTTE